MSLQRQQTAVPPRGSPMYTVMLGYTFAPKWLALPRAERNRLRGVHVAPLLERYADRVRARFFDAEAFQTRFSDFALLETEDLTAYYFLVEELRDTPLVAEGYLAFKDVVIGIEDGFQHFERSRAA
ncbi:darcynin family protein [Kitasatospora sp. NPDC058965]|uniref:darcynin family protein n=1 Tax=Kitasatospora sp. NPDC058965 TaxID=3346682 RepID=UPI00367696B7